MTHQISERNAPFPQVPTKETGTLDAGEPAGAAPPLGKKALALRESARATPRSGNGLVSRHLAGRKSERSRERQLKRQQKSALAEALAQRFDLSTALTPQVRDLGYSIGNLRSLVAAALAAGMDFECLLEMIERAARAPDCRPGGTIASQMSQPKSTVTGLSEREKSVARQSDCHRSQERL